MAPVVKGGLPAVVLGAARVLPLDTDLVMSGQPAMERHGLRFRNGLGGYFRIRF